VQALGDLWQHARDIEWTRVPQRTFAAWGEHDILTFASAISFQVAFALIPLTLCVLGVLGSVDLQPVWSSDIAPDVRSSVSPDVFRVIDETVRNVLERKQLFWATAGAAIAVWEVSGAMRGVMDVLDRIYEAPRPRPFWSRVRVSIGLSVVASLLLICAAAVVRFGPRLVEALLGEGVVRVLGSLVSWLLALALMSAVVALVARVAPTRDRPARWVTAGTAIVVGGWTLMSLVFGWYLTSVADYGSIFGNLATVVVVFEYLYLSAIVFLTGLLFDSKLRDRLEGRRR
jgi:membrane protein